MSPIRVLHLIGSPYNDFHYDLSCRDGGCNVNMLADLPLFQDYRIALITPDSRWRFPSTLKTEDIDAAKSMSLSEAIQFITTEKIDVVIPHMYCVPGITHYRALFDILKIPYMGNPPDVTAIAAHKGRAKAIVAAAGVKVPFGEVLRPGDVPTLPPPAVVKPASSDNSLGMSFVKEITEYTAALKTAFKYSDEVIVETFIPPGREVRCGIIVKDGKLIGLPLEEYEVDEHERPIRTHADKFPELDADGKFIGWPQDGIERHRTVDVSDPITEKVHEVAKKCHIALGCRHYSAFDFRIDPTGEPWFLEAGLYCSFDEGGGILGMARAAGMSLEELSTAMIKETLNMNL